MGHVICAVHAAGGHCNCGGDLDGHRLEVPTKHTPGPWRVEGLTKAGDVAVWSVHPFNGALHSLASAHNTADARLIAAAPDLLAALEEAADRFDGFAHSLTDPQAVTRAVTARERARAAIARARGDK